MKRIITSNLRDEDDFFFPTLYLYIYLFSFTIFYFLCWHKIKTFYIFSNNRYLHTILVKKKYAIVRISGNCTYGHS